MTWPIAIIYIGFFALIGMVAIVTKSPGALWALLFMPKINNKI